MILCGCMIQQGQAAESNKPALEQGLSDIAQHYFNLPAATVWTAVAAGNGWTAGEPSTSSLAVMYVPQGLEQQTRTALLNDICNLWMSTTGCSINEIVATARDLPEQE